MAKQIETQLVYKKVISFNMRQKESLQKLKEYDININEFIRAAIREKIKRDWKNIKERKLQGDCPF